MDYTLRQGKHLSPDEGLCAMEYAALLAGEPHTDRPACIRSELSCLFRNLNDKMPSEPRQRLKPYVLRAIGIGRDFAIAAAIDSVVHTYRVAHPLPGLTDLAWHDEAFVNTIFAFLDEILPKGELIDMPASVDHEASDLVTVGPPS